MDIFISMGAGIIVGRTLFNPKYKALNEKLQTVCTVLLIFSMGVMLGRRDNFLQEIAALGWKSLVFCLVPSAFSALLVFALTRQFIEKRFHRTEDR